MKQTILISACLMGMHCRYNGTGAMLEEAAQLMEKYHLIPVCPEIYGGMMTPRNPAERCAEKVVTAQGEEVTDAYLRGAEEILRLSELYACKIAILKERSPSCGYGTIYDGTFSGTLVPGNGITAELLAKKGVRILGESKVKELLP